MADSLLDTADPRLPIHILERLPRAQAAAEARVGVINARLAELQMAVNARLVALQQEPGSKKTKLKKLRAIADEFSEIVSGQAACKRGCTHCCHIPVALVQTEADLIGEAIGLRAKQITRSKEPSARGYGYHMPCPFLKNNACSIYEHRPLSCRLHFNMDDDDLLCALLPDMTVPVPLLNMTTLQAIYMSMLRNDKLADIRDFFPEELK